MEALMEISNLMFELLRIWITVIISMRLKLGPTV
jgi:hypothetical protein